MIRYLRKKTMTGLLTILFSFIITFFLIRYAPGEPIKLLSGKDNPNPEQIEYLTEKYGLDQPVLKQFIKYISNALKGDLGYSYKSNEPVTKIISKKILPTILLTLTSSILSVVIGTSIGLYSGRKVGSKIDNILCSISYILDAIPSFWLGLILILIFSSKLKILPTSGMRDVRQEYEGIKKILDILKHMILPVMVITIIQIPIYFRIIRSSTIQVLNENFIKTFRATGMEENKIFRKFVLKNAIIPVITTFSLSFAFLLSGVSLIEIVFAWPGMGRVIMDSVKNRDYPVLTGIYLLLSISISISMIITDILYSIIDPRIRLE